MKSRKHVLLFLLLAVLMLVSVSSVSAQVQISTSGSRNDPQPVEAPAGEPAIVAQEPEPIEPEEESIYKNGVFKESFDDDFWSRGWDGSVLIGNPNGNYFNPGRKRLSFNLPTTEVYAFLLNEKAETDDVYVEATFENIRSTQASYGVVCRYSDEGWYEVRANVAGPLAGSFALYKYDTYLKEIGKVPYVRLHPDMIQYFTGDIKLGMNVRNTIGLSCVGDEIRVFINGKEQTILKNTAVLDNQFDTGSVGVMVQSYANGIVDVDLVKFSAELK